MSSSVSEAQRRLEVARRNNALKSALLKLKLRNDLLQLAPGSSLQEANVLDDDQYNLLLLYLNNDDRRNRLFTSIIPQLFPSGFGLNQTQFIARMEEQNQHRNEVEELMPELEALTDDSVAAPAPAVAGINGLPLPASSRPQPANIDATGASGVVPPAGDGVAQLVDEDEETNLFNPEVLEAPRATSTTSSGSSAAQPVPPAPAGPTLANRGRAAARATGRAAGAAASATGQAIATGARATGRAIFTGATATSQAIATGARATGRAISTAASATSRSLSPVGEAIGRGARSAADATASGLAATGTAILGAMDLGKDGMPIDIMGDRYFLDSSYRGAADFNTLEQFCNLYGIRAGDAALTTIYKVFQAPVPMTDKGTIDKIEALKAGELTSLERAINTRIDTLRRTINTLTPGTVIQTVAKYKLDRMRKLYGWITSTLAKRATGTPPTLPTTTINYRKYYKELRNDVGKNEETRKHKYMFEAIMAVAYYLANPDFLLDSTDTAFADKQAIVDKFEGVLELIDKGHLHDLVKSIKASPDLNDKIKDLDAMNYFDRIRLKEVLKEKADIGASNETLRQLSLPTMDEVMSERIVSLIKLFHANKYIDASIVSQIEDALRDKNTLTLMGSLGNAVTKVSSELIPFANASSKDTVKKLFESFKQVYNFYKKVYDPVFTFIEEKVVGTNESDIDKWPLNDMTRILNIGITKYQRADAGNNFGVYKMLDVNNGVADFIKKLQIESRFTEMAPSLKEAFGKLAARQILDDDVTRAFVNFTPNIRYLLYDQQFDIPRRADIEELLEDKLRKITAPPPAGSTKPNAKAIAQKRVNKAKANAAAAAPAAPTTGGGPDEFHALQDFFTPNTVYMFVNHKDKKQGTILNPRIIAPDNTISQPPDLAYYKQLKQNDLIREPIGDDLKYIQLNITILAISCMIIFYKRLEKIST